MVYLKTFYDPLNYCHSLCRIQPFDSTGEEVYVFMGRKGFEKRGSSLYVTAPFYNQRKLSEFNLNEPIKQEHANLDCKHVFGSHDVFPLKKCLRSSLVSLYSACSDSDTVVFLLPKSSGRPVL